MTTNDPTTPKTRTRMTRITGILFEDGTTVRLSPDQYNAVVVEELLEDASPASPAPEAEAPRLARGSTPPPAPARNHEPPALPRADVRRGGFKADWKDERLKGRRVLARKWEGKMVRVTIDRDAGGFVYDGMLWPSLSSIARRVCGHNRNGWEFFGLAPRSGK
jgi:hypothetical protein